MEKLFKVAKNEAAFLKCGIQGLPGSGKTYGASSISIGLWHYIKSDKPIFFFDTETGSDLAKPLFDLGKVPLYTCKSRAFIDLSDGMKEAQEKTDIVIIDSITHYWEEIMESYRRKKKVDNLNIRDWMFIKQEWKGQFLNVFLMSKLHIIMCGRGGWDFGYTMNDRGEMEYGKTDSKMRVESETGFEPFLSIEMERIRKQRQKIGSDIIHRAWVIKDRNVTNSLTGKYFDEITFENILPHIQALNLGGTHKIIDTKRGSEDIFKPERSMVEYYKERDILLENLKDELDLKGLSGRSDEIQKKRIEILRDSFGTSSKTEIESLKLEDIKKGLEKVKKYNPIEPEKKEEKHPAELWREILTLKEKITNTEWNNILSQHFTGKKEAVDFTEPQMKALRIILENHIKEEQKNGGGKRIKTEKK